jgi:hypothetical protein
MAMVKGYEGQNNASLTSLKVSNSQTIADAYPKAERARA